MADEAIARVQELWSTVDRLRGPIYHALMSSSSEQAGLMEELRKLTTVNENLSKELLDLKGREEEIKKRNLDLVTNQEKLTLELKKSQRRIESLNNKLKLYKEENERLTERLKVHKFEEAVGVKEVKVELKEEPSSDCDSESANVESIKGEDANNDSGHSGGNVLGGSSVGEEANLSSGNEDVEDESVPLNEDVGEGGVGLNGGSVEVELEEETLPVLHSFDKDTANAITASPPVLVPMKRAAVSQCGSKQKRRRNDSMSSWSSESDSFSVVSICENEDDSVPLPCIVDVINKDLALAVVGRLFLQCEKGASDKGRIHGQVGRSKEVKKTQEKKKTGRSKEVKKTQEKKKTGRSKEVKKTQEKKKTGRPLGRKNQVKKWPCLACKNFWARTGNELEQHVRRHHIDPGYVACNSKYGWCLTCSIHFSALKDLKVHPSH